MWTRARLPWLYKHRISARTYSKYKRKKYYIKKKKHHVFESWARQNCTQANFTIPSKPSQPTWSSLSTGRLQDTKQQRGGKRMVCGSRRGGKGSQEPSATFFNSRLNQITKHKTTGPGLVRIYFLSLEWNQARSSLFLTHSMRRCQLR